MSVSPKPDPVAAPAGLPASVAAYIAATNAFDADALMACFADGALVNDQLRDYWGTDAIRTWAERELIGDKVTMEVVKVVDHFGDVIVTAHVDGEYDKTGLPGPLVLAFHFAVRADKIVRLIILNNRAPDSSPEIRSLRAALAVRRPPDAAPEA
ncbi:nuclear transport factor 2 family protein [Variovorax sp. JS1663]|uniref:nuclear transport factor 2 family protein n=1 Tax=Variovorax sp. JS1663 TaxID=1851577 RepID=UPI000B3471B9|nr:nuclear transport factor 2 family protein [Variovorax sp. JS1663]OUL99790.1 hypothetical protein A8M77_24580 [Variovorax sp. JS1663]